MLLSSRVRPADTLSTTLNSILTTIRLESAPTLTILAKQKQACSKQSPFKNEYLRPYGPPRSVPGHPVPTPSEAIDYMIDNGFSVA